MRFTVSKREIKCIDATLPYIGDNADYEAVFSFDDEWNDRIKTARFIHDGKVVEQILTDDKCVIPVEVLKRGYLKIGVYTDKITSTPCEVYILESIKETTGITAEPTPDVYSQIIRMIEDLEFAEVTDEQIEKIVREYLEENPVGGVDEAEVQRIVAEYVKAHKDELKGDKGDTGENGKSAYEVACANGFSGTETEWLMSLKGEDGKDGSGGSVNITTTIDKNSTNSQVPSAKAVFDQYAPKSVIDSLHSYGTNTWRQSGWYRIAEYSVSDNVSTLKGAKGNGCLLAIKGEYQTNKNSDYLIKFSSAYNNQRFDLISAVTYGNTNVITKIRYTYNETEMKGYIEVYYSVDKVNAIYTEILAIADRGCLWKGVTPYATEETVEGVTVVTTLDIPANAIPATSIDIARLEARIAELESKNTL